ncbi:hypothetical protein, partial [Clostridium botulinum]|uniref:hypothetical protein n=1 Tax=Clostridium botulinum TaxID=1491 RepID=UPI001A9B97E8
ILEWYPYIIGINTDNLRPLFTFIYKPNNISLNYERECFKISGLNMRSACLQVAQLEILYVGPIGDNAN